MLVDVNHLDMVKEEVLVERGKRFAGDGLARHLDVAASVLEAVLKVVFPLPLLQAVHVVVAVHVPMDGNVGQIVRVIWLVIPSQLDRRMDTVSSPS